MIYLIILIISLALFIGFLVLVSFEGRTGTRLMPATRARLDAEASRIFFILAHVDLVAFARDLARRTSARIAHDVAHLSLILVRFLERLLTRAVRALRARSGKESAAPVPTSPFVRSMSDLKHKLRQSNDTSSSEE